MKLVRRLLLGLMLIFALVRGVSYLVYAVLAVPSPVETYYLEAKMVLLAYRAEMGLPMYPEWRDYPHVANFFGPVYFGLVGRIGRVIGAELSGLFRIGRVVSLVAALGTVLIVGIVGTRLYGRVLGTLGWLMALGTPLLIGFSVMTRPDQLAEFLGVLGFFLASARRLWVQILGGLVLVLAALTKQTTAIFVVATVLGWVAARDWRRGLTLGAGVGLVLVGIIAGVTIGIEPSFAASLAGESKTPWSLHALVQPLQQVALKSVDLLYWPVVGVVLWGTRATGRREPQLAVLAAVLLVACVVSSAKVGSDVNYYLSLRAVAGLAVAGLWRAWSLAPSGRRSVGLGLVALVGLPGMLVSGLVMAQQAEFEWFSTARMRTNAGRAFLASDREFCRLAADPQVHLLTDSGLFDLHARERAMFGDPWLFRLLVNTGRIDPRLIRSRIDAQYYDLVALTSPVDPPAYDDYSFGLPKTLADRVRQRYVFAGNQANLFLYTRRPTGAGALPAPGPP